jgi:hypothetical protein
MIDDRKAGRRWHLTTPAIAGLVALVSGIVTLAFTLAPSLKPDPGTAISASLAVVKVEPHARYSAFLRRLGGDAPRERDRAVLEEQGYIAYLRVEVVGRKRKSMRLRYATYVARSGRRYESAQDVLSFKSDTPSDRWVAPVFVVDPGLDGRFFARFELYDHDVMLAVADTPPLPER